MAKRIKPYAWGGFGHNPFGEIECYEIGDGKLVIKRRHGKAPTVIPLEGAIPKPAEQSLSQGLNGVGDVIIERAEGNEICHKVPNVKHFIDLIGEEKQLIKRRDEPNSVEYAKSGIPSGTVFSDQMLVLPPVSQVFNRALWIQHCQTTWHPRRDVTAAQWVERGEPLCSFPVYSSTMSKLFSPSGNFVSVRSPISGLLLFDWWQFGEKCIRILPPIDHAPPASAREMYRELCDACYENRKYIFQNPSEFEGSDFVKDENLMAAFDEQMSLEHDYECIFDNFTFIEDLLVYDSEIRPHIEHLFVEKERRVRSDHTSVNSNEETQTPHSSPQARATEQVILTPELTESEGEHPIEQAVNEGVLTRDSTNKDEAAWTSLHDEAAKRFGVQLPYSESELRDALGERQREAHEDQLIQIKADYQLLRVFAV